MISTQFSFSKLLNVFLRIAGIGSKFILFTMLSKSFDTEIFANYGLITTLITIFIFVIGLDFYNFSIRDILTTKSEKKIRNKVATTAVFYSVVYLFFIGIGYFFLNNVSYVKPYVFLVLGLCITEHLSQEIYRFLIGFGKVLLANLLLFIRTMGWSSVVLYLLSINKEVTISFIFKIWLITNVLTISYVFLLVIKDNFKYFKTLKIDVLWIKKGLTVCYIFFIATVSLKMVEYSNRFIVDYFLGKKIAGVFTFYSTISILITVYINTIVISFELPDLIRFSGTTKIHELLKKFKKSLSVHITVASVILLLAIYPLLYWQDKIAFQEYLPLLFFMIIAVGFMNYSLLYHFKLYIFNKDLAILRVMIKSGILSIVFTIVTTYYFGVYGAAFAYVITGAIMYYLRYQEAKRIITND